MRPQRNPQNERMDSVQPLDKLDVRFGSKTDMTPIERQRMDILLGQETYG